MTQLRPIGLNMLLGCLLAALALAALLSSWRIVDKGLANHPADIYSYWYPAHFLWQGIEPYTAWSSGREVDGIVWHLDEGKVPASSLVNRAFAYTPANSAPVMLLLSPLAFLSFSNAVTVWGVANLGLILVSTLLLASLLGFRALSIQTLAILMLFLSFTATRGVFEYGQTTLLIVACMLGALSVGKTSQVFAGVLGGIALAKYSLGIALLVFFIYKRRYIAAAVVAAVQLGTTLLVGSIGRTSFPQILEAYRKLLAHHVELPGMNLQGSILAGAPLFATALVVLGTVFLVVLLWRIRALESQAPNQVGPLTYSDFVVSGILLVWSLLAVYHRLYDNVVIVLPLAFLLLKGDELYRGWSALRKRLIYVTLILIAGVSILPIYLLIGDLAYLSLLAMNCAALLAVLVYLALKLDSSVRHRPIVAQSQKPPRVVAGAEAAPGL